MLSLVLALLLMSPAQAARFVPTVMGRPGEAVVLRRIAKRESWLVRVGIHERDRWSTRWAWHNAVSAGYLRPSVCPFHRRGAGWWGTRGAWGHVAAFAAQYLPCLPPWVLDIPVVSAWVAMQRLRVARGRSAPRALRAWAGVG